MNSNLFKMEVKEIKDDKGIVYLLLIDLDEGQVIKIGLTTRPVEERCQEIITSYWKYTRVFPRLYTKRFKETNDIYNKEQKILEYLKEYKYEPKIPMQGRTEMVKLDLDIAVKVYEDVLNNMPLVTEAEPCGVCGKDKKFLVDGKFVCGHKCKEPKKRSKKH